MKRALLTVVFFLLCSAASPLLSQTGQPGAVKTEMVAETAVIHPGEPFWVALQFETDPQWHIYWKNPGDSGFPTTVDWELPDGFTVSQMHWPAPSHFTENGLVGFGYSGPMTLLVQVHPPKDLKPGQDITLKAHVQWVACGDACMPGSASLATTLAVADERTPAQPAIAHLFDKARTALPIPGGTLLGSLDASSHSLTIPLPGEKCEPATFYPYDSGLVDWTNPQVVESGSSGCQLKVPVTDRLHNGGSMEGVLVSATGGYREINVSVSSYQHPASNATVNSSFFLILLAAFAGGALLNLMPCVLPVLSLKLLSLMQTSRDAKSKERIKLAGSYTGGILASFWALAGALMVLRGLGEKIGWGFQLQEPLFVAFLACLFFVMALNLCGVFEMGTSLSRLERSSPDKPSLLSSFLNGVLAVIVATPCTGPFLGTALGFASTLTPLLTLVVFSAMGLGLASPYLLVASFPRLSRLLPRPGAWMATFKQAMGFLLFATVLWLLWVFGALSGTSALFVLLFVLLALGFGFWFWGRFAGPSRSPWSRRVAHAFLALILGVSGFLTHNAVKGAAAALPTVAVAESGWEPFSQERLRELRAKGLPVFIDFTARWCLTCQANHVVLERADVAESFAKKGVVKMRADWTQRDAAITDTLQTFGRNAVPLYVFYEGSEQAEPQILPQILTASALHDLLGRLPEKDADDHP